MLLPVLACALGGALRRSYRAIWKPPLVFLASFLATFKVALATSSTTLLAGLVLDLGGAGAGCLGPFLWPAIMIALTSWCMRH